jgi:hypothetical protein
MTSKSEPRQPSINLTENAQLLKWLFLDSGGMVGYPEELDLTGTEP